MTKVIDPGMLDLLDTLYRDYYEANARFCDQTSAHWQKYGALQNVQRGENNYTLHGVGFGDFAQPGFLKAGIHLPTRLYLWHLLKHCDPNIVQATRWVATQQGRRFSYDLARMALTVDLLSQHIPHLSHRTLCIIGDGYGSLGCIIKKMFPNTTLWYVNLGRTLFFDLYYTYQCFPDSAHTLIRSNHDALCKDFNYVEAEQFEQIAFEADIFINIASMQEMNYQAIAGYFNAMRKQKKETWFYCCNRSAKTLPDGTVIEFSRYGWQDNDQIIFDALCPWHQRYPKNRPPFFGRFDGPHWHRLIKVG